MSRGKRAQRVCTEEWGHIQQYSLWPEQVEYELIRQCVLFHEPAVARAQETGVPARTISRKVKQFEEQGMVSLFAQDPIPEPDPMRVLPDEMRQVIVDLHAEHPGMPLREIARICSRRFGRQPSHHSVQSVLASGLTPSHPGRRFPPYADIADPYQRRHAVVTLHNEGWSISSISAYMQLSRQYVAVILQRWAQEGHAGLNDKSRAPHEPARKVTFEAISEVRRIAVATPELGSYRVRARLEQLGMDLSQSTCKRLLTLDRQLSGMSTEKTDELPRQRKEMPYKARFRHQWWSVDIRHIEHHSISGVEGYVYQITILENYSPARSPGPRINGITWKYCLRRWPRRVYRKESSAMVGDSSIAIKQ